MKLKQMKPRHLPIRCSSWYVSAISLTSMVEFRTGNAVSARLAALMKKGMCVSFPPGRSLPASLAAYSGRSELRTAVRASTFTSSE